MTPANSPAAGGRHGRRLPQTTGACWGPGPDHRDNPRRDPRHLACLHGRGRDLRNVQDVSHHRADRDGRLHRRVARGQRPSPRLAQRSRRSHPMRPRRGGTRPGRRLRAAGRVTASSGAITGPRMSLATKDTRPAVVADERETHRKPLVPLTLCHHGASPGARHATREMHSPCRIGAAQTCVGDACGRPQIIHL